MSEVVDVLKLYYICISFLIFMTILIIFQFSIPLFQVLNKIEPNQLSNVMNCSYYEVKLFYEIKIQKFMHAPFLKIFELNENTYQILFFDI